MKKIAVFSLFLAILAGFSGGFLVFNRAYAADSDSPGILPTNPFYFVKRFSRTIQRLFTFNSVSKASLELEIADQKMAELNKLSAIDASKETIVKAANNYNDSLVNLKNRVQSLKDTSVNVAMDNFLEKLIEKSVLHQTSLADLKRKHDGTVPVFETAKENTESILVLVSGKEEPEKFKIRLERIFDNLKVNTSLPPLQAKLQAVEIVDRLEEKIKDQDLKKELTEVKRGFSERVTQEINTQSFIDQLKKNYPGDALATEPQAKLMIDLTRVLIEQMEKNSRDLISLTDEAIGSILERAKNLVLEAEILLKDKKYSESLSISDKARFTLRDLKQITPEPIDKKIEVIKPDIRLESELKIDAVPQRVAPAIQFESVR